MAGKPIRLGKAAGELNVGLPTIVEFLVTKGIKIDSNPNTRLEPEHFDLLLKEFAADQSMMEKAKGTSNRRERRETVTMSDIAPEEKKVIKDDEEEGDSINLEEIKRKVFEGSQSDTTKIIPPKESDISENEDSSAIKETNKVQIVGKIDLDALNLRSRPEKKPLEDPKIEKVTVQLEQDKPVEVSNYKTRLKQELFFEKEKIFVTKKNNNRKNILIRVEEEEGRSSTECAARGISHLTCSC